MKKAAIVSLCAALALSGIVACQQASRETDGPSGGEPPATAAPPQPATKAPSTPQASPTPAVEPPEQAPATGQGYQLLPPSAQLPAVLPEDVTPLTAIRERPAVWTGKEVTVLGVVAEAIYGGEIKDCAWAFRLADGTSEAWVLPLSKTTPKLGKTARMKATVLGQPDRPWAPGRADTFYLQVKDWSYETP